MLKLFLTLCVCLLGASVYKVVLSFVNKAPSSFHSLKLVSCRNPRSLFFFFFNTAFLSAPTFSCIFATGRGIVLLGRDSLSGKIEISSTYKILGLSYSHLSA